MNNSILQITEKDFFGSRNYFEDNQKGLRNEIFGQNYAKSIGYSITLNPAGYESKKDFIVFNERHSFLIESKDDAFSLKSDYVAIEVKQRPIKKDSNNQKIIINGKTQYENYYVKSGIQSTKSDFWFHTLYRKDKNTWPIFTRELYSIQPNVLKDLIRSLESERIKNKESIFDNLNRTASIWLNNNSGDGNASVYLIQKNIFVKHAKLLTSDLLEMI